MPTRSKPDEPDDPRGKEPAAPRRDRNTDKDGDIHVDSNVGNDKNNSDNKDGDDDGSDAEMQALMGFGGFGTTKNSKVIGNMAGGVRKDKKSEYRQYMNRVGGFNRALSPTRK